MAPSSSTPAPETLHPSLWLASQLARSVTRCIDTGHPVLSYQLPGRGWPAGSLVEILPQQTGIGEMRLLAPALAQVADRRIVMLQPPHVPQVLPLAAMGLPPESVIWLRSDRLADALWAAEQVLRSGSCGALLFWPENVGSARGRSQHVRAESLRRLHLAAQCGETLFFMMRSMAAASDSSPAPLRLSVRPALGGIEIGFVKRQGPVRDKPLFLPMRVESARPALPQRDLVSTSSPVDDRAFVY
jgi:protein ImuA